MKKRLIGVIAAILTLASTTTYSAANEYYLNTVQDKNTVTVEVVAGGAVLPAIEFTVELPEGIEADSSYTTNGAIFNKENGRFAWAGIQAPADGTVMYSVTFKVKDGFRGEVTVVPAEGYEADMSAALKAEISDTDTTKPTEDTTKPTKDTTEPTKDTTKPTKDTTEPTKDTTEPTKDTTEPTKDTTKPTKDTTKPTKDTTEPTKDTTEPTKDTTEEETFSKAEGPEIDTGNTVADKNPAVGIVAGIAVVIIAGAAILLSVKRKKNK